jgi:hypothetical protein
MPDIDQLESIPIGTMRPPQNLTPDKSNETWVLQVIVGSSPARAAANANLHGEPDNISGKRFIARCGSYGKSASLLSIVQ